MFYLILKWNTYKYYVFDLIILYEYFSHQSTFSTKVNIGGLIDYVEFCGIHTTKRMFIETCLSWK